MMQAVLRNRSGTIRSGWKILVFLLVMTALSAGGLLLLKTAGVGGGLPAAAVLVGAMLFASAFMTRTFHGRPLGAIGLRLGRRAGGEVLLGLAHGFLMMGGIFVLQVLAGWVDAEWVPIAPEALGALLGVAGLQFLLAAGLEELAFRGYPYQVLMQGITVIPATLALALAFSLAHTANPNITGLALLNIALASVWLSAAYLRTRSLWYPTALHFSWNFSQTTIFGFPTSGLKPAGNALTVLEQSGPAWVTGGAFGPEGGLLASVVLMLAIWLTLTARRLSAPHNAVTLETVP